MILCAGLGTRLRPLSEWCAKPMVPVGDAPVVEHVRRRLAGFDRIVVNVHHRPDDVRGWAPTEVRVSDEPVLLGTAGGLAAAADLLGPGRVLVWNGDILCDLDPEVLLRSRADAALAIAPRPVGEGNVGVDGSGRVVRLRTRERFGEEVAGGDFLGIHVVGERLRALLPRKGCLVGDLYLPALAAGTHLEAVVTTAPFRDIGNLASYVAANRAWLGERASWSAEPHAHDITGSIVGRGARIEASATRCIVWPGAVVDAPVRDAIVTPAGRVSLEVLLDAAGVAAEDQERARR